MKQSDNRPIETVILNGEESIIIWGCVMTSIRIAQQQQFLGVARNRATFLPSWSCLTWWWWWACFGAIFSRWQFISRQHAKQLQQSRIQLLTCLPYKTGKLSSNQNEDNKHQQNPTINLTGGADDDATTKNRSLLKRAITLQHFQHQQHLQLFTNQQYRQQYWSTMMPTIICSKWIDYFPLGCIVDPIVYVSSHDVTYGHQTTPVYLANFRTTPDVVIAMHITIWSQSVR